MIYDANPTEAPVIARIAEIARMVVAEQIKLNNASNDNHGFKFLAQVTGFTETDYAETLLADPKTWIRAIMFYLEEREAKARAAL